MTYAHWHKSHHMLPWQPEAARSCIHGPLDAYMWIVGVHRLTCNHPVWGWPRPLHYNYGIR